MFLSHCVRIVARKVWLKMVGCGLNPLDSTHNEQTDTAGLVNTIENR